MPHEHHHGHHHTHGTLKGRKLFLTIVLNCLITFSQVIGGILSGSLSLISDALHNFSDVLSLLVSYTATVLAGKKASGKHTFGYKRAEIIAAFVNSATLIIVAVFLVAEAIERFINPKEVDSTLVIWLSAFGILANGFSVLLLRKEAGNNMNMKSAYLHLFTDMLASVAVLAGGILMKYFSLYWVDPLLTIIIAVYLIYMGYKLLKDSTRVLMLFTPQSIEVQKIVDCISAINPVQNVHHVHIWQMNDDQIHLEAHVDFMEDISLSEFDRILVKIEKEVRKQFNINHISIQPEFDKCTSKSVIVQD